MRTLNKIEKIISTKTRDKIERKCMIQEFMTAYRDSPHPATGITPYEAMNSRAIRTKLGVAPTSPKTAE